MMVTSGVASLMAPDGGRQFCGPIMFGNFAKTIFLVPVYQNNNKNLIKFIDRSTDGVWGEW